VASQIDTALAASGNAAAQFHAADALLTDLRKREDTTKANYELGEISKLEYLGMRLETASAELARLQALNGIQQAAGDLEEALQGPLDLKDWILETPDRTPPPVKEHMHE
jgi:outer membrane protein, heavy metal efflux system